jgi:hypothetical protein
MTDNHSDTGSRRPTRADKRMPLRQVPYSWRDVASRLQAYGVDTTKISRTDQANILQQALDMADGNEARCHHRVVYWADFADTLIRKQPAWETPEHWRRRKHAEDLDLGDSDDGVPELAASRFAALTRYDNRERVHSAGDDDKDLRAFVARMCTREYPERVTAIVDLDTGTTYANGSDFAVSVTVTFNGQRYDCNYD